MIKRYLTNLNFKRTNKKYYDVIIVGTGVAGLYTALNVNDKYKILMLTKDKIDENNSNLAQGGIAACISNRENMKLHMEDTLKAGSYHNDKEAVRILVSEAPENIQKLVKLGAEFDRNVNGNLMVTMEGGHSERRIIHSKDQTGKEVIRALSREVKNRSNIEVIENSFAIDIITHEDKCIGVLVENEGEIYAVLAKAIVLATGGIGQTYVNTTNSLIATGDGIAMAYRAGAEIIDMEFVQFHPTAFYSEKDRKRFLISEAVRGEGAVLRNNKGEAFMKKYHKMRDLAPRDIVSKAILTEMKQENATNVYLDITHKNEEFIINRFPHIYKECLNRGIDITKEYIPVCPVQHYMMGGIKTDYKGRTSITSLYACGETASLGVHGANRLASNSLLDGIVFGNRVANDINESMILGNVYDIDLEYDRKQEKLKLDLGNIKETIKEVMSKYVFAFRSEKRLSKAFEIIKEVNQKLNKYSGHNKEYYECANMAVTAYLIIDAALKRKKSLGSHIIVEDLGGD